MAWQAEEPSPPRLERTEKAAAHFLLRDGNLWALSWAKVREWERAFQSPHPGWDVRQELLQARQWLLDNPRRRKTPKGMTRYLGNWLRKAHAKHLKEWQGGEFNERER